LINKSHLSRDGFWILYISSMKHITYLLLILVFTCRCSEKKFQLALPDIQKIESLSSESEFGLNEVLVYLEMNYKKKGKKTQVRIDDDGKTECGYTQVFDFDISYTTEQCEEASNLKEIIIFPRTSIDEVKKWVESIYASGETDIPNVWYNDHEYGPNDKEVGCYYTISQSGKTSKIAITCGC